MLDLVIRSIVALWLASLAFGIAPAAADPGKPGHVDACASENALGVSRIVEIDSTTGPQLGLMQYKDHDFLRDGEVVLTFDDGPLRRLTQTVLDALDAYCAKATFFVVGRMAVVDPGMVKEMAQRGHTVGTHTWSHRNLRALGPTQSKTEIELGISAASKALGAPVSPFFRFPYLSDSRANLDYLRSRGLSAFSIDIDTKDFRTRSGAEVQRRVMAGLKAQGKGIVLFHDIQPSTASGIKGLLAELKARGYKLVHLVAKAPVTTEPEFDAIAEKEFNRRHKIAAADPLATRSVVWPMAGEGAAAPEPAKRGLKPASNRTPQRNKPDPSDPDWALRFLQP